MVDGLPSVSVGRSGSRLGCLLGSGTVDDDGLVLMLLDAAVWLWLLRLVKVG